MGWDAFCEEHFEEALKHIEERFKDCDVGWCDAIPSDEGLYTDDGEAYVCGFPGCNKYPAKEIMWIKKVKPKDYKFSKYEVLK